MKPMPWWGVLLVVISILLFPLTALLVVIGSILFLVTDLFMNFACTIFDWELPKCWERLSCIK